MTESNCFKHSVFLRGVPEGQPRPRPRYGGRGFFLPRTAWVDACRLQARLAQPRPPYTGPVALKIIFLLPRPKSRPKKNDWPTGRPDLDNLLKGTIDSLTHAGWWEQDSLIVKCDAEKRYTGPGETTGALVWARPVTEAPA